jgi:hypothetical protein
VSVGGRANSPANSWVQAHAEDRLLSQEETQVVLDTLTEAAGEVLSQIAQQQST